MELPGRKSINGASILEDGTGRAAGRLRQSRNVTGD